MSKSLAAELEVLASSLTTGDERNSQSSIPSLAQRIAKTFDVKRTRWQSSRFLKSGAICISWFRKLCAM